MRRWPGKKRGRILQTERYGERVPPCVRGRLAGGRITLSVVGVLRIATIVTVSSSSKNIPHMPFFPPHLESVYSSRMSDFSKLAATTRCRRRFPQPTSTEWHVVTLHRYVSRPKLLLIFGFVTFLSSDSLFASICLFVYQLVGEHLVSLP